MKEFKERYSIEITTVGFDQNHVHIICQFLPKYSGGQVIGNIKSNTGRELFKKVPELKKELYGGEFWTDGYFASTVGKHGTEQVIRAYVKGQGQPAQEYRPLHTDHQLVLL